MKRVELVVSGVVQGVGFRYFCQKHATQLGITGSVENLPDGTVRIEAQGEDAVLAEYRALVSNGPRNAVVSELNERELPVKHQESELVIR